LPRVDFHLARPIGDRQPTARRDGVDRPIQPPDGIQHAVANPVQMRVVDARADMHVESDQAQSKRADNAQGILQLFVPDTMFAQRTTGVGLAIVTMTEARIDPEPYRMSSGNLAELDQHVGRAAVHRYYQLDHPRQSRVVDNVGGEHDLIRNSAGNIACPQGALYFAERDGIHEDIHLAKDTEDVNVAVCFLGKPNAVERLQLPDPLAHWLGLIPPERRSYVSRGPMHGVDEGRSQGVGSGHAIALLYA
jgi:hypothetical protein